MLPLKLKNSLPLLLSKRKDNNLTQNLFLMLTLMPALPSKVREVNQGDKRVLKAGEIQQRLRFRSNLSPNQCLNQELLDHTQWKEILSQSFNKNTATFSMEQMDVPRVDRK